MWGMWWWRWWWRRALGSKDVKDGEAAHADSSLNSRGNLVPLHPISTAIGLHYLSPWRVRLSVSKPLRADQSPFAASAPGCFSPYSTILSFLTSFVYPAFPLAVFILLPLFLSDLFSLASSGVELPTTPLFCHRPPPSHLALSWPEHLLLPSSHSSLTHWQKRRSRIRCELNLLAVKT